MTYVRVHRAGLGKVVETTVGLHLTSLLQCLTWLVRMCDMTHSCMWVCDITTHSCMGDESFVCVTWPIQSVYKSHTFTDRPCDCDFHAVFLWVLCESQTVCLCVFQKRHTQYYRTDCVRIIDILSQTLSLQDEPWCPNDEGSVLFLRLTSPPLPCCSNMCTPRLTVCAIGWWRTTGYLILSDRFLQRSL